MEPESQPATAEHEESIYETQKSAAEPSNTNIETNLQNQNFTYFPNEKKVSRPSLVSWQSWIDLRLRLFQLCYIGNDVESIPTEMIYEFGLKTLVLDLSFNCLR